MRNLISVLGVAAIILMPGAAGADTIYLKNGSVLKGRVASYAEDQFVVVLNLGSDRFSSKATIFSGDVSRIEFDSAGAAESTVTPPREINKPARNEVKESQREAEPVKEPSVREQQPKTAGQPESARAADSEPAPADKTAASGSDAAEVKPSSRSKPSGVKPTMVDVIARRDWTSTGLILRRGDRVRISATGSVTLDQSGGLSSGPDGIDQPDSKKLMQEKPTGALIAVIGADNDDFIFIGGSAEFTATRNGLLFLSVNEGTLADNSGSYKAVIEVQSQSGGVRQ